MHVGIISREYPPFFGGGIGTYTIRMSRALVRQGHRATVLTVSDDGVERREEHSGVYVVRLPFLKGHDWSAPHPSIRTPRTMRAFTRLHPVCVFAMQAADALPRLHRELRFDVVEAPDTGALGWYVLDAMDRGAMPRLGVVTVIHSPSAWVARLNREPARDRGTLALLRLEREQALASDGLLSPSASMATYAGGLWFGGDASRIDVIPHPLGDLEDVARAAAPKDWPAGRKRVLFAGRLEPRKGVDTLLLAFASAIERGAELDLELAGDDMPHPDRPGQRFGASLIAALPEAVRARIVTLGKLREGALHEARQRADVIAVPSPTDNFPGTCVEAMASARVVIAARAGGMAEMIEHERSGLLFAPGSADDLTAALVQVSSMDAARARSLAAGARERITTFCDNRDIIARRIEHFARAAEAAQRRSRPSLIARVSSRISGRLAGRHTAAVE